MQQINWSLCFILLLLFGSNGFTALDKDSFFKTLSSDSYEKIKTERLLIEKSTQNKAYLGAILMKEAQFLATPKAKLEQFKKGKVLLEQEIKEHPDNQEFRFLRLIIQENCPKALKYSANLKEDSALIIYAFSKNSASMKKIIREYAQTSKMLNETNL